MFKQSSIAIGEGIVILNPLLEGEWAGSVIVSLPEPCLSCDADWSRYVPDPFHSRLVHCAARLCHAGQRWHCYTDCLAADFVACVVDLLQLLVCIWPSTIYHSFIVYLFSYVVTRDVDLTSMLVLLSLSSSISNHYYTRSCRLLRLMLRLCFSIRIRDGDDGIVRVEWRATHCPAVICVRYICLPTIRPIASFHVPTYTLSCVFCTLQ